MMSLFGCVSLGGKSNGYALRLNPEKDLRQSLVAFVKANRLQAAHVLTCVGSLTQVQIRYANQKKATTLKGHFEIVSLVGTLAADGGTHLHISVSDKAGRTFGGHLLDGSKVYTTAEIVLGNLEGVKFKRKLDPVTTFKELSIEN